MTWYCGYCHYMNAVNDLYCCNCQRIRDNLAFSNRGVPQTTPSHGPLSHPSIASSHRLLSNIASNLDTHGDDCHETYRPHPLDKLDLDFPNVDPISKSPEDPHDGKWRRFWFCCECGDGPYGMGNIPACSICRHVQCTLCNVVRLEKRGGSWTEDTDAITS